MKKPESQKLLTPADAYALLVSLVVMNDLNSLDTFVDGGALRARDRDTLSAVGLTIRELVNAWQYTATPEFASLTAGRSAAVAAMQQGLALDPHKNAQNRERFLAALPCLLQTDDAFALTPTADHSKLEAIRQQVALWSGRSP